MMKKICFYARSAQCELFAKLGFIQEMKGNAVSYIVQNSKEEYVVKSEGCKGNVFNIDKYLHDNWSNDQLLHSISLTDIEKTYQIPSLWSIYYTDRYLVHYNYDDSIKFIKLHIAFIFDVFKASSPEFLYNEEIAIFSSYIFYLIGAKHDCKYIGFSNPRLIGDKKVNLVFDNKSNYPYLDDLYTKDKFSKEAILEAKEFVQEFRLQSKVPPYLRDGKFSLRKPRFEFYFIVKLFRYLILLVLNKKSDRINYMEFKGYKRHLYSLKNYVNYLRQRRYYQSYDQNVNFYYFPLHYQPEASTLVNAQNFEKQLYAVDLIAKKIPADSKLYIKEHFSMIGHREMYFYESLKKFPNVTMLSPFENSHDLIRNSKGVIVLTGTAGWEAILYGKPTYVLGNAFFNSFRFTNNVENIDHLSNQIAKNESEPIEMQDYDKELIKYVAAYLNSSQEGFYYLLDKGKVLSKKNLDDLTCIINKF
jgi:hypothetical protein